MSRYRLELASEADDADLRAVLAATPMPGRIALTFRREPSFFGSMAREAEFLQVIACRDVETGRIVGFGSRSVSRRYVNGAPMNVGYLSGLRLLKAHRNLGLVARGYKMLRELHEDGRAAFYLTTIAAGNDVATRVLTSGRAGLPVYEPFGRYVTSAMPFRRRGRRVRGVARVERDSMQTARTSEGPTRVLRGGEGPRRQFFPCADPPPAETLLAYRRGALVGCLGVWDQSVLRQTVVDGYSGWLGLLRPAYNSWARWLGRPTLPPVGGTVDYVTATCPIVVGDDAESFDELLRAARSALSPDRFLMLGLHERDPLLPVARRHATVEYVTDLYLVHWGERPPLDDRPPYLELGCL